MFDSAEDVAAQMMQFIECAQTKAGARMPVGVKSEMALGPGEASILPIYKKCLDQFSPTERGVLAGMIRTMSKAL
jgi:hypothetical protein